MNLYNLRILAEGHYAMAKFDPDFNVEAIYNLHAKGVGYSCDCPAGQRSVKLKPCKHQRMLPFMLGAVNTDRFYDPEAGRWHQPLAGEANEIASGVTEPELAFEPPTAPQQLSPQSAQPPQVSQPPSPAAATPIVTRRI